MGFRRQKVYLCGNNTARDIAEKYAPGHEHAFDASFMETIYRKKSPSNFFLTTKNPMNFRHRHLSGAVPKVQE